MSYTQGNDLFAAIYQSGINHLITAYCTQRGHVLSYSSRASDITNPIRVTQISPITIPGLAKPIDLSFSFSVPSFVFYNSGSTPQLNQNQFSLGSAVSLIVYDLSGAASAPSAIAISCVGSLAYDTTNAAVSFSVDDFTLTGVAPPALATILELIAKTFLNAALAMFELSVPVVSIGSVASLAVVSPPSGGPPAPIIASGALELWAKVSIYG